MRKRRLVSGLLLCLLLGSLPGIVKAQSPSIEGIVKSNDGKPIPFASVQIKNNGQGVVADESGHFLIHADPGAVLIISAANFETQEIQAGQNGRLVVTLKASLYLQDVVVTALGIKRARNALPYSTQTVSAAELDRTPGPNFINNLTGKVAGLQVSSSNTLGGSNNVILRGYKSLTQNNQALFVVDGVPYDNSNQSLSGSDLGNVASDINPDDIESVTVLKGAAASALYGSRAANGVIVVITKSGGKPAKGLGVTINESIQVGSPDKSTLPKYQTQYGQGYGSAGYNPAYPNQNGFFYYTPVVGSGGQPEDVVQTDQDQVWGPAFNAGTLVYQWDAFSPTNANYGKPTPWVSAPHHSPTDFFSTPVTNLTSVFVDGGSDKASFKAGYTNSYQSGLLPNSNLKKNALNFSADFHLNDKVVLGGVFNYVDETGLNRDSYDFRASNSTMRDFRQWWPTNVNLQEQKADYFRTLTNVTWNWNGGYATAATGNLPKAAYHNNAYWTQYQNYNNDARDRYFGNIHLTYQIAPFLSLLGRVSKDNYDQLYETRLASGSYQTSGFSRYNGSFSETNYDLLFNFDKDLSSAFNLKALLGGNVRQDVNSSESAATSGGLVVPEFYALSNSVKTPAPPVETYSKKEVDGVFAGATLTYQKQLSLDATIRRDQSSALPEGHNSYYYPAVSASWQFSKLLPAETWLSYGKLRANYAEVGNDAPVYSLQNTYAAGTPFNNQTLFTYTTTNNNPNLVPERNKSYELGLEAALFHNRLGFDVTWYHSQLINQIMPITPSTATGFNLFYVNGGTVQNQGVEVSLHAIPVRTRDFTWDLGLNWSKNNNKVVSLYGGQPSYTVASFQNSVQLVAETGKSYGVLRGTDYVYINGQREINSAGYPVLSSNAKSDIGNVNPDLLGSITNSFSYKRFSLSFLIDIKKGGDVYSLDQDYGQWSGVYPETAGKNAKGNPVRSPLSQGGGVLLQGLTVDKQPNTVYVDASDINADGSQFPFSSVNSLAAKSYVYDAGYVKLREVSLAYSLPHDLIRHWGFVQGIDVSLSGRNLWIIHKNLPYSDPEQAEASTTLSSSAPIVFNPNAAVGYQTGAYPSVRQLALNLKLKF